MQNGHSRVATAGAGGGGRRPAVCRTTRNIAKATMTKLMMLLKKRP
jgi:hypothetical protein